MITLPKLGRWIVLAACALEGFYFLLSAYWSYEPEEVLGSQWLLQNLAKIIILLSVGLLFLCASYLILKGRPIARPLSGVLLLGLTLWVLVDTFSGRSPIWSKLIFAILPFVALVLLGCVWASRDAWRMENHS